MKTKASFCRSYAGFTLTEVLIAMTVGLFVSGGAMWMMVYGVKNCLLSTAQSSNDLAQWGIASRLWVDARIANGVTVYADSNAASLERWLRKSLDERGNMLVLSLSEQATSNKIKYTKLTGYIFTPATSSVPGSISRFDYNVSAADQAAYKSLENILKDNRASILASARPVASRVALNSNESAAFLVRTVGTAASLCCNITSDDANASIQQNKLIEATFIVRG